MWMLVRMMKLQMDYEFIVDVYVKEVRLLLEYGSVVFHSGLTKKESNEIENVQRQFLSSLSFHLNVGLTYSEARICFGLDLLSERRLDQCYTYVRKHLDRTGGGKTSDLFKLRNRISERTRDKTFIEPQYKSTRFYQNPLNFLTRVANEIMRDKVKT